MDNHIVKKCPASSCEMVQRRSSHVLQPFSIEQLRQLFVGTLNRQMKVLLLVAGTTGLRRSELLALTWPGIDFDHGTLFIRRRFMTGWPSQDVVAAFPKRERDYRKVMLTPLVIAALKQHLVRQNELKSWAGASWHDQTLVFCTLTGYPLSDSKVMADYRLLLQKTGLRERSFHELRYSAASILLDLGTHPQVIRAILGEIQQGSYGLAPLASERLPEFMQEAVLQFNRTLLGTLSECFFPL